MTLDAMMLSIDAEIISRIGIVCSINDRPVRGIWYDNYIELLDQDGTGPGFHCRSSDVDWVRQNDVLIKGGDARYRIVGTPAGDGITRLRLVKGNQQ